MFDVQMCYFLATPEAKEMVALLREMVKGRFDGYWIMLKGSSTEEIVENEGGANKLNDRNINYANGTEFFHPTTEPNKKYIILI